MSSQKFSFEEREALWLAYDKKCIYTSEPLEIDNFHIDHIIPEDYAKNLDEFRKLKNNLSLEECFDIFGYENLAPCKPGVNLRKNSSLFEKNVCIYYLSIAKHKKELVIGALEKIISRNNKGKATIRLIQYLDRGLLSRDDVTDILDKHSDSPQEIFSILKKIEFENSDDVDTVTKENIDELMNLKIRLGGDDHIPGLDLWSENFGEIHVSTCLEYDEARKKGYFPRSNFDIMLSISFEHQCGLLKALKKARTPSVSYVSNPRCGVIDLNILPFTFFPNVGEQGNEYSGNETYKDKINSGDLFIRKVKHNSIVIEEAEGMGQLFVEVVRADFNNDGLEEILLYECCYATHGTLIYGGIRVITRRSADSLFEEVEI